MKLSLLTVCVKIRTSHFVKFGICGRPNGLPRRSGGTLPSVITKN
jgi:hypothetical protein